MLRPFDLSNTKRVIDHSENAESPELTSSKESPSDNNKAILANKQDVLLLKKKNSNNNPILTNKNDTNKKYNKPLTPLKRSGSTNSLSFDTPTNKRLDSKYREIESGYQHEEELEYIPEEAIPIDINDFGDSIHMEAYEEDLDIKHPESIIEEEFSLIKSKRQFQIEKDIKQQDFLQDEDVYKQPTSKYDLEKAIEKSITMPEISQSISIEYPDEIEYCPPHEEESKYIPDEILSIDLNDFDDTLVFEAYEGSSSDSELSESLYEIESSSYKKSKRQFQINNEKELEQQQQEEKDEDEHSQDEDVYKKPITKQSLIKAIENSIIMPDINDILPVEFPFDIDDGLSFEEVYQFVV